jgi:surfactin family lipopeptide synthetase C
MNAQGIEDIYELSPLQQGILFHSLYESDSQLYFEQVVVPFEGVVSTEAFEKAWNCVANANTAIRTSFHWEEVGKPVQVVHNSVRTPVEFRDMRSVVPGARDAAIEQLLADDRRRGFDLQRAPLLRLMLIQFSPFNYRLILTFHHIILDGWSLQIVVDQFREAYAALCTGGTPTLPKTRPYRDHIQWLQRQDLNEARAYWKKTLASVDGSCRMFAANGGTPATVADYAEHGSLISADTSTALRQFGSAHSLTLNTIVQGAWALLLHRLTGSTDVVFGVTVSGRPADLCEVETMVGLFINTVPLRVQIDLQSPVHDWLDDLQKQQFEARQLDYSPLVQIREWSELPASAPLFETLFAFENYPVQARGAEASAEVSFVERTNYPLSVALVPGPKMRIRLLYKRNLIGDDTIRSIAANYELLLMSLAQSDGKRIADLDTLTGEDRVMLARVNATHTSFPKATIPAIWRDVVAASPAATAVEFGAQRTTYAELDAAAAGLSSKLSGMRVGLQSTVAVLLERSPEFITAILAILKAGAAYLPLDPAYPDARLKDILQDIRVCSFVTSSRYEERLRGFGLPIALVDSPPTDEEARPPVDDRNESPDDPAYVMYTSGSTGAPKGIVVPHRAVVRLVRNTNYISIGPQDRLANASNCAFDASTFEIWGALLNGACAVVLERDTVLAPRVLASELRRKQISTLFLTTALFNQVALETPDAFSILRVLLFGGETVDPNVVRKILRNGPPKSLEHVYGPTESTTFATCQHVVAVDENATTVPIGTPIANTTAYVLDACLNCVPAGGVGELYLGGDGLAHGYHEKPGATAERFLPNPFSDRPGARIYRTGDLVRWRPDGGLEFVGRIDTQVKIRGHRVELGEVEQRLKQHPNVQNAVATVRQNPSGERFLAGYYVARDGGRAALGPELRALLREYLPEYMVPSIIQRVDSIPLNGNGKVDHGEWPEPEPEQTARDQASREPCDEVERKLVGIWQHVLGLKHVGLHEGFFDIGGHSLRATQLVSQVRRELGIEISLRSVFERPTIAGMAEIVRQQPAASPAAAITRASREDRRRVTGAPGG